MIEFAYTHGEVSELATLHSRAFPDFFLSRLGPRFLRQFYLGYTTDPTAVICLARDQEGGIQGVCVGTTNPSGFFSRLLKRQFIGFVVASAAAALRNPSAIPRLLAAFIYRGDAPPDTEGAFLSSICVAPEARGQGVGGSLDRAWKARAKALGSNRVFLTTDAINNDEVNAFYRRNGWILNDQYVTKQGRQMNRYRFDLYVLDGDVDA